MKLIKARQMNCQWAITVHKSQQRYAEVGANTTTIILCPYEAIEQC